jgi:6-hydroxycyclohex-1-ene-1-carbonyl-CoA dehydrogenase
VSEQTTVDCWELVSPKEPLVRSQRTVGELGEGQVLVRVAGCGVCHTDIGYIYDGVRTRHELPLTLGHEIAGVVERAAAGHDALVGKSVVVPAVIPCGSCELCQRGRGMICRKQIFPGCDVHGGFASHVVVPAHGLCLVDEAALAKSDVELADLSVLGDAVSTAYQSAVRAELGEGDLAIFVGVGGVGGFGVQIARAMGAHVVAIDVAADKLERVKDHGAHHTILIGDQDPKAIRKGMRTYAKEHELPSTCWKVFECSGTAPGQVLAFSLLTFGSVLGVVGYTRDTVNLRLSNLMAFDASAIGNWGCLPEHYPAALKMVLDGSVVVAPFIEQSPMSMINDTLSALHHKKLSRRPVLIPDFE